jgi:hypothetical protein
MIGLQVDKLNKGSIINSGASIVKFVRRDPQNPLLAQIESIDNGKNDFIEIENLSNINLTVDLLKKCGFEEKITGLKSERLLENNYYKIKVDNCDSVGNNCRFFGYKKNSENEPYLKTNLIWTLDELQKHYKEVTERELEIKV